VPDAILYSVGANEMHGLRHTNEDKRRAVLTLLNDPGWSKWSDPEILGERTLSRSSSSPWAYQQDIQSKFDLCRHVELSMACDAAARLRLEALPSTRARPAVGPVRRTPSPLTADGSPYESRLSRWPLRWQGAGGSAKRQKPKPGRNGMKDGNSEGKAIAGVSRRTVVTGIGAAGMLAGVAPFSIVRAAGGPLKVGVLLPRSGVQAGIGQDCQRGVEVTKPILKDLGLPDLDIMSGDTESNEQTARAQAEKLIGSGAQVLVGAFDSGQTAAIAQVAEQKGIPLIINIAAAPQITEQGYKFVFRNFPTAGTILANAFEQQLEIFKQVGTAPKSVVFMHVNDTFGTAMAGGISHVMPKFPVPYKIADTIAYDPKARDLSVEVAKAKATGAEALLMVSRLNDAILITREMVKQRWTPDAVMSMGPGWYEDQYLKTLGKLGDGPLSFVPWYDPKKKLSQTLEAAMAKAYPDVNLNTNQVYTFEALLVAADAYKRAGSADPKALADAIRTTKITDNVSIGPGIMFNEKGQNDKVVDATIQNIGGKLVVVEPEASAVAKVVWPMPPYDKR
jgi:branched-chain amino acid transport system substrate-binding protein